VLAWPVLAWPVLAWILPFGFGQDPNLAFLRSGRGAGATLLLPIGPSNKRHQLDTRAGGHVACRKLDGRGDVYRGLVIEIDHAL
jgi:hypothetical protein